MACDRTRLASAMYPLQSTQQAAVLDNTPLCKRAQACAASWVMHFPGGQGRWEHRRRGERVK